MSKLIETPECQNYPTHATIDKLTNDLDVLTKAHNKLLAGTRVLAKTTTALMLEVEKLKQDKKE